MSDTHQFKSFAELTGLSPEQLRQPASRQLVAEVVDHSSAAIRSLIGRVERLETKLKDMEADK